MAHERPAGAPDARPVAAWQAAETNAVVWMRWLGFPDARQTAQGADGGVDVAASGAFAQVKWLGTKAGVNPVRELYGARGGRPGLLVFFCNSGYSAPAREYAGQHDVALFVYSVVDGMITPENLPARAMWRRAVAAHTTKPKLNATEAQSPPGIRRITDPLRAIDPVQQGDPTHVGPYVIIGRIGSGGMGVVYSGMDPGGRRAAVKVVRPQFAEDPDFRARFAREAQLPLRIQDTCVARVLAADTEGAQPWLATEYIPGPTLAEQLTKGPLAGDMLLGLAAGLAKALNAVHAAGVVHRDLKPANIILSPDGPKVIDLGIARALDHTALTATGMVFGTPGYMSPEQFLGLTAGSPADVYAWGLIILAAATGREPHRGVRAEAVAYRAVHDAVDLSGLPAALQSVVGRAVAKDPAARPTAGEILAEVTNVWHRGTGESADTPPTLILTRLLRQTWDQPAGPDPTGTWPDPVQTKSATPHPLLQRRKRGLRGAAFVGAAAVLIAGAAWVVNRDTGTGDPVKPRAVEPARPNGSPVATPSPDVVRNPARPPASPATSSPAVSSPSPTAVRGYNWKLPTDAGGETAGPDGLPSAVQEAQRAAIAEIYNTGDAEFRFDRLNISEGPAQQGGGPTTRLEVDGWLRAPAGSSPDLRVHGVSLVFSDTRQELAEVKLCAKFVGTVWNAAADYVEVEAPTAEAQRWTKLVVRPLPQGMNASCEPG